MDLSNLILSQLADPFRIGLMVALVITMQRTQGTTGVWVPLAAGVLFVAVIIPSTMLTVLAQPLWQVVAVGMVSNAIILAVILGAWAIYQRFRR